MADKKPASPRTSPRTGSTSTGSSGTGSSGTGSTRKSPPRNTMEVEMSWLEPAPAPEKVGSVRQADRADSASTRPSKMPRRDTIEVDRRWLVPPLPSIQEERGKSSGGRRKQPPPLPPTVEAKPKGRLAPPIPREEESVDAEAPRSNRRGGRPSKRPPRT